LHYLSHCAHEFIVPVDRTRSARYTGLPPGFPWRNNLHEIPFEDIQDQYFDCILFQHQLNYTMDQYSILSDSQRDLPKVYLEHDPPRQSPTEERHIVDDPGVLLVHVTHFNRLMWDSGRTPVRVIEHGVAPPEGVRWNGELRKGIVVVNNLAERGRRLGLDIFDRVRREVPLDLVGIGSEALGGLGDVPSSRLASLMADYRFFFNPIRYTSLGLAVCEAMMLGMPVIGLATTELVTVVENGVSGWTDTRIDRLIQTMQRLLSDADEARRLGEGARRAAMERFNIQRFASDWNEIFRLATGCRLGATAAVSAESAA
jgi:glycosyltransferase involved in cell wall biosynthesis